MEQDLNELDAIAAHADTTAAGAVGIPAPAGVEGAEPGAPAGPDFGVEAAGMVDMFAALVGGYCPAAGELWNDAAKQRTAAALAPVLEKYGVSLGGMPPEITLAIVAGPLLWQTSRIVARQIAAERATTVTDKREPAAGQAQGGASAAPETLVHPQMALYTAGGGGA